MKLPGMVTSLFSRRVKGSLLLLLLFLVEPGEWWGLRLGKGGERCC